MRCVLLNNQKLLIVLSSALASERDSLRISIAKTTFPASCMHAGVLLSIDAFQTGTKRHKRVIKLSSPQSPIVSNDIDSCVRRLRAGMFWL